MTIGQVSRLTDISCHTIRYYIEIGLIVPIKHSERYDFSNQDVAELDLIKMLKSFGFTLIEIHNIITLHRTSYVISPRELGEYVDLLKNKRLDVVQQIEKMQTAIKGIDELISQAKMKTYESSCTTGIPIDFLTYFKCPMCDMPLNIDRSYIQDNQIMKGLLKCSCGYKAIIKDGILLCSEKSEDAELLGVSLLSQYNAKTLSVDQKAAKKIYDALSKTDLKDKLILETNIDRFFYLLMHITSMDAKALFIVADHSAHAIKYYKDQFDRLKLSQKILFIVSADYQLPLIKHSIDVWIDYFDSNIHAEKNKVLLPEILSTQLKKDAKVYGAVGTTPPNAP